VDEIECLLLQGANVLHLCDSEFNIAPAHAIAVCDEIIARGLDRHVRWYAYLAVLPFDSEMAARMRRAGCVGINFTGDSASETMLAAYRQPHRKDDMAEAIRLCRRSGIRVMIDLLLGGPGETPVTLRETTEFLKQANPDVIGAALGVRLYPGTEIVGRLETEDLLEAHPGVRRAGDGPVDLLRPTYFVSPALGDDPLGLLRDLVGHDDRFFVPEPRRASCARAEPRAATADSSHNYNRNEPLLGAIASGARGAYWDILRRIRVGPIRGALPPPSTTREDVP
jgi:hypothetical protein